MKLNIDHDMLMMAPEKCQDPAYPNREDHDPEGSVWFRFTRREVATADLSRFLTLFAQDKLDAAALQVIRGNLVIQLPSAQARHDEPFLCVTTRHFCRALYIAFPGWAFFFSLENLALWKMSLALVDEARVLQSERAWKTRLMLPPSNVKTLIEDHLEQARVVASRAGLSDGETAQISRAVRAYFTKVMSAYCVV
jgi:hypothetical protein